MSSRIKKIFWWLVFLFILYSIFTKPQEAAGIVNGIWDVLYGGAQNLARFFDALLARN